MVFSNSHLPPNDIDTHIAVRVVVNERCCVLCCSVVNTLFYGEISFQCNVACGKRVCEGVRFLKM